MLFGKLQQGVPENQQILTIARMRADAEEVYGQHLGDIMPATERITDGFQKDDGASVRKVCSFQTLVGGAISMLRGFNTHKMIYKAASRPTTSKRKVSGNSEATTSTNAVW